jgi:NAD(P)-dependent dehydrogenase (short-subunit alcohol dehydrogenase family)
MARRFDLSGRVAFVTGGGGHLGRPACLTLADAGAAVAVIGRNLERCQAVADDIIRLGGKAIAVSADVLDQGQIEAAVRIAEERLGPIDILLNNAGITSPRRILETSPDSWDRIVEVNLKGCFLCTQAVARGMAERGRGKIVNMASLIGTHPVERRSAYGAAKAGMIHFTRSCAIEFGPQGITVNALAPTVIETELTAAMMEKFPDFYQGILRRTPLGRLGKVEDLEGPLLVLASPASDFVSGQVLNVDGGYSAS